MKHQIITWESSEQIPLDDLNEALKLFENPQVTAVETGSNDHAVVVTEAKHRQFAQEMWDAYIEELEASE